MSTADISKKKPIEKNRVAKEVEHAVVEFAFNKPAHGQVRVSNELKKKGILISPGGVRSVWLRHDLETFKKRLKALEARVAEEGGVLTAEQVVALERAKQEKEAHGQIETEHPGYLGSQDTFYVGTLKGDDLEVMRLCRSHAETLLLKAFSKPITSFGRSQVHAN